MTGFLRHISLGLLGLALIVVVNGCGDKQESAETPAASVAPASAPAVAAGDKGEAKPGSRPADGAAKDAEAQTEGNETALVEDGAVATVNGVEISYRAYNREVALEREFAQVMKQREPEAAGEPEINDKAFEKDALTTLINFELAYQESQRLSLKPAEEEIEQTLSLMKANYSDESEFGAALQQNSMTVDELKEQIRHSLAIKMWQEQEFVDKITVSDEEAEKVYKEQPQFFVRPESIMVSHILLNWPDEGDRKTVKEEARQKMADIRKKATAEGADFNRLARELSNDPTVQDNGGNLGWITKGITVESFEVAAFALEKPGQISEIVESPFGFHIIKLEEKQPAGPEPFENVKDWLKAGLTEEKIEKAVQERLVTLKSQADIKISDPKLVAAMAAGSSSPPDRK